MLIKEEEGEEEGKKETIKFLKESSQYMFAINIISMESIKLVLQLFITFQTGRPFP